MRTVKLRGPVVWRPPDTLVVEPDDGKEFTYLHNSTNALRSDLYSMRMDEARIGIHAFRCRCSGVDVWARKMGYAVGGELGLHVGTDPAASFYRSQYRRGRCYFIRLNEIEFIWTRRVSA